jgi:hypothetical protein
MKAIISNKIYMTVDPLMCKQLEKELTYKIPSYNDPDKFVIIKNLKIINYNIAGGKMLVAFPVGRLDLIPKNYEVVDKRALNPVENFPEFGAILRPSQQDILDNVTDNCMINAKVGFGKAQPAGSLVRVPGGWKTIESVEIGDSIITPSGNKSKVLGKFYHKDKPIYKVTFADGRHVEACEEHLWGTIDENNKYKVLNTKEILNNKFFKNKELYVPLCSPIEDNTSKLPLHPYVLGAVLKEGNITHKNVKISSTDIEVINRVKLFLPEGFTIQKTKHEYSITGGVANILREMGLHERNSFIPEVYKFTSVQNKLFLLQGLFDTDGDVNNGITYYTTFSQLANGVAEVVRSLGGMCNIEYRNENDYVLNIQGLPLYLKKQLFSSSKKSDFISAEPYDDLSKLRIDSIEYVGNKDCWCISIDSEDKLYLTDQYIVTHNTFTALAIAAKLKQKTLIIVHTVALRSQWEKEIIKTLGIKPGVIGSGKFNTDSPVVVANIQSLVKHVNRINREFGLVVLDECHHVSSPTFSKVIDGMFSRYKIGLSGTLERKDQKHVVFKDYFSSKIFRPDKEGTLDPEIHIVNSGIVFSDASNAPYAQKINTLMDSYLYRNLVVALADNYVNMGHTVMVVADRIEFIKYCNEQSKSSSEIVIGETKDREAIIDRIYSGQTKQIWGTQSLVSEGWSVNPLSCLILATPLNNIPTLEQLIGRIQRMHPGKINPVVVDIKLLGGIVTNQHNNRLGHYMKEGYKLTFL